MADKLERIRLLLSLATDKGAAEEEARTAAMQAVRLIVEHEIDLVEPFARPKFWEVHAPASAPPPPPPPPKAKKETPKHPDGKVITSKLTSWCRVCRAAVNVGDPVYWVPGHGVAHYECWKNDV